MQLRLPRFRSPVRDQATDEARAQPIKAAIEYAIRDAKQEIDGLSARILVIRSEAAAVYDSYDDIGEREKRDEERISAVESRLLGAEARLRNLMEQLSKLQRLHDDYLTRFPADDPQPSPVSHSA